ncbi:MAG: hypothetical protein GY835_17110 [bacterium]|nr:hypothetical protein [bacterium]
MAIHRYLAAFIGLLLISFPARIASAGQGERIILSSDVNFKYRFTEIQSLVGTGFHLIDAKGSDETLIVASSNASRPAALGRAQVYDSELYDFGLRWSTSFKAHQGGLAAFGDLNADARDDLVFWENRSDGLHIKIIELTHWASEVRSEPLLELSPAELPALFSNPTLECRSDGLALPDLGMALINFQPSRIDGPSGLLLIDRNGFRNYFPSAGRLRYPQHFAIPRMSNLPDDGASALQDHLLFQTSFADMQGNRIPGEDDSRSYWVVRRLDGSMVMHRAAGGAYSQATTFPLRTSAAPGYLIGAMLRNDSGRRDQLRIFDHEGQLEKVLQCHASLTRLITIDLDRNGNEQILAGFHDGSLVLYNGDLAEIGRWWCEARVTPMYSFDLFGDGQQEILVNIGGRIAVLDSRMQPLAALQSPITLNSELNSSNPQYWLQSGSQGRMIIPVSSHQASVFCLDRNPGIVAGPLPVWFPWLLPVPLIILLIVQTKRGRAARPQLALVDGVNLLDIDNTPVYWQELYPSIREFRHSRAYRKNLERMLFHLNNYDELEHSRLFERFRTTTAFFIRYPLPALKDLITILDDTNRRNSPCGEFSQACEICEKHANEVFESGLLSDNALQEFKQSLKVCIETVRVFKDQVQEKLSRTLGDLLIIWLQKWKVAGFRLQNLSISFTNINMNDHMVMLDTDFFTIVNALVEIHMHRFTDARQAEIAFSFVKQGHDLHLSTSDSAGQGMPFRNIHSVTSPILKKYSLADIEVTDSGLLVVLDLNDSTTVSQAKQVAS